MGVLLPPWARAALLVLASTLASSGCEDEAETTSEAPQESVSTAARDLPEVDRVALMERHYDAVITAHDAVIAGDHETAKAELTALAGQELPAEAPDSWRKAHEAMQAAAGRTDGIRDVDSAAAAVASTARACAQCHEQLGRVPLRDHKPPTPKPGEALQAGKKH